MQSPVPGNYAGYNSAPWPGNDAVHGLRRPLPLNSLFQLLTLCSLLLGGIGGGPSFTNAASGSPVTNSVTYAYLPNSDLVRTATARAGAAPVMTTTRGWDHGYRLRSVQNVLGTAGATVNGYTYDYDDVDRRTRATLDDASAWAWDYDDRNGPPGASRFWADQTLVAGQQFEFAYDAVGNRQTMKRGGDEAGAGRLATAYTVNQLNQYTAIAHPGAADVLGVATAPATVTVNGQAAYERGEYWWKSVPVANGTGPQWAAITNTAASGGTSNVVGRVYVPPAAEALVYDADGNLTQDGRWTYAWDAENRLVRLETAPAAVSNGVPRLRLDFGYDWQNRRLSKTVLTNWSGTAYTVTNGSRFLYDGWNLVAELNATNAPVRSHVWGLDLGGGLADEGNVGGMVELLDHSTGPPGRYFAAYDGNANLTALVKGDQTVGARYEYGPFGELLRATGPVAAANPVRWSSRYWDAETDLVYYGWRYYSPAQGRWLGRDPIEEADAVNLHAYVRNNPVAMFDRLGQSSGSSADNQAAMSGGSAVSGGGGAQAAGIYHRVKQAVEFFNDVQEIMDVALSFFGDEEGGEELFMAFYNAGRESLSSGLRKTGGDSFSARFGREEHEAFKTKDRKTSLKKGWSPKGSTGMRVDAADLVKRIIYELKPGTRSGQRQGRDQIARYLKELNKDLKPGEKLWQAELVFY